MSLTAVAALPSRTLIVPGFPLVFTLDAVGSISEFWRCGELYLANTANTWTASCCGQYAVDGTRQSPTEALRVFFAAMNHWGVVASKVRSLGCPVEGWPEEVSRG